MLTVKQLFIAAGLDVDKKDKEKDIKLVRHRRDVKNGYSIYDMIDEGCFELYQQCQSGKKGGRPFDNCEFILSFLPIENNKAEFYGAYQVNGSRPWEEADMNEVLDKFDKFSEDFGNNGDIRYDLKELEEFQSYRKRVILEWTGRFMRRKDLDIYEVLPATVSIPFPGYQEIVLSYDELKSIFKDPPAHRIWENALKPNAGIYRIVDLSDGKIYIGSAYGKKGLWSRWQKYAKNGHGDNKCLKERDPKNFQWSIVRTLSTTLSKRDVIQIEKLEKKKHDSRNNGLNQN